MRNQQTLLVKQLNRKLRPFVQTRNVPIPVYGWINTIRTSLNMTMAQLGDKLNITRQGVKKIEESEANGTITLNSMKKVAQAMDFKLVYALIPKDGNVNDLIEMKAKEQARRIVLRTHQNMKLEDQGIDDEKIEKTIDELADEIKQEMRKSIWD